MKQNGAKDQQTSSFQANDLAPKIFFFHLPHHISKRSRQMTSIYRGQKPRSLSSFFSIWPPTQNEDYTSSTTTCLEEGDDDDRRARGEVTSGVPVIYIKELFTHGSKPFVIIICGRGHFVKKHMLVAAVGGSGVEVDRCH